MTEQTLTHYKDLETGVYMPVAGLEVKTKRNRLLYESDWTDTLSAKPRLGDDLYNNWQTYRQALRDIPAQPGFPNDVIWPTKP